MELIEKKLKSIYIKPEFILFLLPVLFFFGDNILTSIFICLLFAFALKNIIFLKNGNLIIPNAVSWILLLFWGIFTSLKTPSVNTGFVYFFGVVFSPFILFLLIQNLHLNLKIIYTFFIGLFLSGILLSFFTYFQLISINFDMTRRISSLYWYDRNILSGYYMILFLFSLSFIIHNVNPKAKIFHYSVLFILGLSIFLVQTRGVWLALLFSISIFFLKKPRVMIITSLIIALLFYAFRDLLIQRYLSVVEFGTDLSSLGRLQAWIASIALIKERLLTGYWFDSFLDLRDNIYSLYLVPVIHSHNTYLRSLLEFGLIGSILYYSFFFKAIYYSVKLNKKIRNNFEYALLDGFRLSFVSLSVIFFFEPYFSLFGCSTPIIWLLISLTFKLKSIIEQESESKSEIFVLQDYV